jgi:hypothetical protein
VTLLADDVGLGKTISAGLVASELISRKRISRLFIVCPLVPMPMLAANNAAAGKATDGWHQAGNGRCWR